MDKVGEEAGGSRWVGRWVRQLFIMTLHQRVHAWVGGCRRRLWAEGEKGG